jgi:DNA-directed RNA polymerase sigma subunit (sigma70/sigma32)
MYDYRLNYPPAETIIFRRRSKYRDNQLDVNQTNIRNNAIYKMWREGATLRETAFNFKISPERVRQIIKRWCRLWMFVHRKESYSYSFSQGDRTISNYEDR